MRNRPTRKLKQWREDTPSHHKTYGEKRARDLKIIEKE